MALVHMGQGALLRMSHPLSIFARHGQKDSESEIELTVRGFRLVTPLGGTLTGCDGDLITMTSALTQSDDS
jgi:hypothetical protein